MMEHTAEEDTNITVSATVYTLKLADDCFYVGRVKNSDSLLLRIQQHEAGEGAEWTKLHPVLDTHALRHHATNMDEDACVISLMAEHGIDKVRGGSYSNIKLSAAQRKSLESQLAHTNDQCARCGRKGHFIASCYAQTHHDGTWLAASPMSTSLHRQKKTVYGRNSDIDMRSAVIFLIYGLIFFLFFFFCWYVSGRS